MSDYFSAKPIPNDSYNISNKIQNNSNIIVDPKYQNDVGNNNNNNNDIKSVHSSPYLMEIPQENITAQNDPSITTSNTTSPTINNTFTHFNYSKDFVLPETDPRSPYYISVPIPDPDINTQKSLSDIDNNENDEYLVREYPTDILMDRFHKWKKILKGLIGYLREISYSQEQFARINTQLKSSVKFHFLTDLEEGSNKLFDPYTTTKPVKKQQPKTIAQQKNSSTTSNMDNNTNHEPPLEQDVLATSGFMKFGSGSIQDIQVILKKHHLALANQQLKISKEISTVLIPKLESLKKDLSFKIKEIKDLHDDFKTNMSHHLYLTHKLLHKYIASVKYMNAITKKANQNQIGHTDLTDLQPKHDPYLLKLQLDLQLRKQIAEENYLQEAYINLQSSGMKLEKIIYSKIQNALQRYSALIDSEARLTIKNLCHELQQGILSKPPAIEWDHFVTHHPTCLLNWKSNDPLPAPRKFSDIIYPNMKTTFAKCIRAGYFYKKSNFTKEYKKGYFVLTPNYLHEFKDSKFYNNSNYSNSNTTLSTHSLSSTNTLATLQHTTAIINNTTSFTSQQQHSSFLTPIMSISLNNCSLIKASKHHFTLKGKAIFLDSMKNSKNPSLASSYSNSFVNLSNTMTDGSSAYSTSNSGTTTPHKTSMLSKKSPFSKLLNSGKSKQQQQQQQLSQLQQKASTKQQESKDIVTWTFKLCNDEPNDSNEKHFKKWIHDLKHLCLYNTTNERMKYIEEKLWKNHINRSSKQMQMTGATSSLNINEYNSSVYNLESSYSSAQLIGNTIRNSNTNDINNNNNNNNNNLTKPQYISINSNSMLNHEIPFRSKINTPAIDDDGNLITIAERKNYSFSPNHSSSSDLSTTVINDKSNLLPQTQSQNDHLLPVIMTPSSSSTNTKYVHHQRNVLLPVSLGHINSINSPESVTSNVSGYFAIPVNRGSNEHSPNPLTPPLSRAASCGTSLINSSRLPKARHDAVNNINRPAFKKNTSTGSLPSLNKQNTNEFCQKNSSSTTNLQILQTSKVYPIRKHKKNISFSSLNSLMFAKKNASNTAFTGNQFIGSGIREDEDGEDSNDQNQTTAGYKIKLNQSIYS